MNLKELQNYLYDELATLDKKSNILTIDTLLYFISDLYDELIKVKSINDLAKEHYEWVESKQWHNKTVLECLALVASEVGEAVNEARGKELSNNFKYELVDIILRVFDLAYQHNIDLEKIIEEKMLANQSRNFNNKVK